MIRGGVLVLCGLALCLAARAEGVFAVNDVWFARADGGYAVRARLSAGPESLARQLLHSGYAVRFKFDMRFVESRDWLPDRELGDISWTPEIVYDSLLERYTFRSGGAEEEFGSLAAALARAGVLHGAPSGDAEELRRILNDPDTYLTARYEMSVGHLPQALQVSLLTGDYEINSGWRRFAAGVRE